jgi:ATP-dependent DNA ligase
MTKTFIDILEELETTTGTNDKIALIKANSANIELKEFLRLALDKNITFGVATINEVTPISPLQCDFQTFFDGNPSNIPNLSWYIFIHLTNSMIKRELTGNAAQDCIQMCKSWWTDLEKKWFIKAILKDLASIGIGQRLYEQGFDEKGFKFRLGLAEEVEELDKIDEEQDGYVDKKLNGYRTTVLNEKGKVDIIYSGRSGIEAENFYFIKDELELLLKELSGEYLNCTLDGEMHCDDDNHLITSVYGFKYRTVDEFIGKKGLKQKAWDDYQEREKEVLELKSKSKFVIFDFIPKANWDDQKYDKILSERKKDLELIKAAIKKLSLKQIEVVETEYVANKTDAIKAAMKWIARGFEGAIFKVANGCYQWKRWRTWVKIKKDITFEVQLVSWIIQKPKYNGNGTLKPDMIGKVLAKDKHNQIHEIGTGEVLDEKTRIDMFNNWDKYKDKIYQCSAQEPSKVSGKYINPRLDIERLDRNSLED